MKHGAHALKSGISSIERMKILSTVVLVPSKSEVSLRRIDLGLYSVFSVGLITTVLRCSGVSLLSHRPFWGFLRMLAWVSHQVYLHYLLLQAMFPGPVRVSFL